MINALTIDVEDYYHVENFSDVIGFDEWDKYESRVVNNTLKILRILDEKGVKATFFVLGWVAERFPNLVEIIHENGHEVASHGYAHKLIYKQTKDEFEEDISKSIDIIRSILGRKPLGYRAPTYSITKESFWAFDILIEKGFKYDSSIFPIKHDRYGIPDADRFPHEINGRRNGSLIEFPPSTLRFLGTNFPIAGGGYLRFFPYRFIKWGISKINGQGRPAIIYIHPWEIDPDQPRIPKASYFSRFRHYRNLHTTEMKFRALIKDFQFAPVKEVLGIAQK